MRFFAPENHVTSSGANNSKFKIFEKVFGRKKTSPTGLSPSERGWG
jgi:hypothetical protein